MLNEDVREQALRWHVRLASGDAANTDYDAFAEWLSKAPDNVKAYVQVEEFSGRIDSLRQEHRAQLTNLLERKANAQSHLLQRIKDRFAPISITPIAAAAAVIVLVGATFYFGIFSQKDSIRVAAAENELHSLALSDGTKVFLGPGAEIDAVYDNNSRTITSFSGLAFFDVASDPGRPFLVMLGEKEIRVLGTSFEAAVFDDRISVAVAEGNVAVRDRTGPERTLNLSIGQKLVFDKATSQEVVSEVPPEQIGSWRDGAIAFDKAGLSEICGALNDFYGRELFSPKTDTASYLQFSGILALSDPATTARRLTELMPVDAVETGNGYELSARSEADELQ